MENSQLNFVGKHNQTSSVQKTSRCPLDSESNGVILGKP